ncbi:hypothetical protein [Paracidovorax wautersii]|uniref:hypothetical protein n=1 Tax=Paracidovorax wautersii TaxID=1177982 RepID=UPI0011138833|nr:hypothetical protein [Paracidovorax wautersii]
MTAQQPYRTGLICELGGIAYWHTGAQYFIAVGSADGNQVDLREIPGFKELDAQFDRGTAIFFDIEWEKIGEAEPEIKAACAVLQARGERLWWKLVADFLKAHHAAIQLRSEAIRVLRASGMDESSIEIVLGARKR